MLQLTPHQTIYLAPLPIDFRKGIDALAHVCHSTLAHDPFSGKVFVFTNKQKTALKILTYDGNGFWLCLKRFSKGRLPWWPEGSSLPTQLLAAHLYVILSQGSPPQLEALWKPLKQPCVAHNSKEAML